VIEPEGEKQLDVLPALHVRLDPHKNEPALTGSLKKLAAAEAAFRAALIAEGTAEEVVNTAFAREVKARAAVREQLTSAHGRLRDLYKARPALAEGFFLKLGRKEGKEKAPGKGSNGGAPAGAAPGG